MGAAVSVQRKGLKLPERDISSLGVKAGILENATYPADMLTDARTGEQYPDRRAGMKVATIAAAHEYGTSKVPARPFMQTTVARDKKAWTDAMVTLLIQGTPLREALMTVGQLMVEDIQLTINSWPADNSPDWAAIKGFNKGLIQTSHLLKSVSSEIYEMGSEA